MFHKERRIDVGAILAGLFGLGTLVFVAVLVQRGTQVDVDQQGLEDGAALNAEAAAALTVTMDLGSAGKVEGATLSFDGEPVEEPEVEGAVITWRPPGELDEGEHELVLSVPRPAIGDADFTWDFTVDTTAPALSLPPVVDAVAIDAASEVSGTTDPGTTLTADGREVDVDDDGAFTLAFPRPPAGPIAVEARDRAENVTRLDLVVPVTYPGARAVSVTAASWDSQVLRGAVLQMLDERRIDTVVLELKNEDGIVGYDTQVARAREIGAVTEYYDLDDAVAELQAHGARVIGRITTFRDAALARTAWAAGQHDQVIQTPDGRAYEEPGEFTNFASRAVRQYNIAIALEAVERGIDDILWDDVRKPGSADDTMVVPGLRGSPADAIVGFLGEAHAALRRRGAYQGVSTAGIAATDGGLVAQDVGRMARNADYLVPTIHPGYWGPGEFGVTSPVSQPYDLVFRAVERYQQLTEGTGAVLVPSLQDFTVGGVTYDDPEVRAQIDAVRARGVDRFVLFDPSVRYTAGAVDPAP
jgi:hypothetical protein